MRCALLVGGLTIQAGHAGDAAERDRIQQPLIPGP